MSISIKWDNPEKTALILTFVAPWRWDEYEVISDTIQQAFDSVSTNIDLIIDLRYAGHHIPDHVLSQLRDAYADATPNLDQYIFVGANSLFIQQLTIADRYLTALGGALDFQCVDTLEDARRINEWKQLLLQYESNMVC